MSDPLEHYALIGDCHGAGLVSRSGSIDWLCIPRFDSGACFAALLGQAEHGRWRIQPEAACRHTRRRYRDRSLTLETEFETDEGTVRVVDTMPIDSKFVDVVRIVEGLKGSVSMCMELVIRFGYGRIVPWVTNHGGELHAIAGPDKLRLRTPVELSSKDKRTFARFQVHEGQRVPFVLTYHPSHLEAPDPIDPEQAIARTDRWWRQWAAKTPYDGAYGNAVTRSLITLKALSYLPTGGVVAAPTASLPEAIGGSRNWDYRYCWLRDATITLSTLINAGYEDEARSWREWLLRAIAGDPSEVQIMYGIEGDRRLPEFELPWLPGYAGSTPVRVGNAAHEQLQLDIYGELMNAMHHCRVRGFENEQSWALERALLDHLEGNWQTPDHGIWEMRGDPQQFVHSKMMCWLAFDRAVQAVEKFHREGPAERWAALRDTIHEEICRRGYNEELSAFTQTYEGRSLDASLLMMAPSGFLPATDPRVRGTIQQIQEHLMEGGLVRRYRTEEGIDGLEAGDNCFLACSFWLVDNLTLLGRHDEARALFDKLLTLGNDVGLFAEEYDVERACLSGNFPQALSHLALVNSAYSLRDGLTPKRDGSRSD